MRFKITALMGFALSTQVHAFMNFGVLPDFAKFDYGTTVPTFEELKCYSKVTPNLVGDGSEMKLENAFVMATFSGLAYNSDPNQYTEVAKNMGFPIVDRVRVEKKEVIGINVVIVDSIALWAENDTDVVISFQGTDPKNKKQVLTDTQVRHEDFLVANVKVGGAHNGFVNHTNAAWPKLEEKLLALKTPKNIHVTGHSLGAAAGVLTAMRIKDLKNSKVRLASLYTFGQPRVGDTNLKTFAPDSYYRFVHLNDGVTRVPLRRDEIKLLNPEHFPEYVDAGELHFFAHDGSLLSEAEATLTMNSSFKGKSFLRNIIDHDIRFYIEYAYRNLSHKADSACLKKT